MGGTGAGGGSAWSLRYGDRHRWRRYADFPPGLDPPKKVRVYYRAGHYLLNWWDPAAGKNLSERVDGDLLAALARARQLDDRLAAARTAGVGSARRVGHAELVDRFLADLGRRADAGEVDPKTVDRYRAALAHYLAYCADPAVAKVYPTAAAADRPFRLGLAAFLAARSVGANGRPAARARPMRSAGFVLDAVRAAYAWAADPDRGGLLPAGLRNPFLRGGPRAPVFRGDPLAAPGVTDAMAAELLLACDAYQLRLLAPLALFGLRAAEPCGLFRDDLAGGWLAVPCRPGLGVVTKGRRDKRFPLLPELGGFWALLGAGDSPGLLYARRAVAAGREAAPLAGLGADALAGEYRRRCGPEASAAARAAARDGVLRAAGGLGYDDVAREFRSLRARLGWPASATPKDLRHLFATALNDGGVPEGYRRYLLGHAPGSAASVAYTHLADLRRQYESAARARLPGVIDAVRRRAAELVAAGAAG